MKAQSRIVLMCSWLWAAPVAADAERAIHKEIVVDATPDEVWDAWTTRAGVISFLAPDARIDARVGGSFHIYFDPAAPAGLKGADDSRYMALQPPKMLSFDWNAPVHLPEARSQRTFVVVRIEPVQGSRSLVRLQHSGWGEGGEWDRAHEFFDRGWDGVLLRLKTRFESGPHDWSKWPATSAANP